MAIVLLLVTLKHFVQAHTGNTEDGNCKMYNLEIT